MMADIFYHLLLPVGLTGSLAFCLLLLLKPLARFFTARWHKVAVLAAAALFLLPLPLLLQLGGPQAAPESPVAAMAEKAEAPADGHAPTLPETLATAAPTAPIYSVGQTIGGARGQSAAATPATGPKIDPLSLAVALYYVGFAAMGLVTGLRYLLFTHRLAKGSTPVTDEAVLALYEAISLELEIEHPPLLLQSGNVGTPLLSGLARPRITLPAIMVADDSLGYALRHELTHHKHHDIACKLLCLLVGAVHWYNPLAHLLRREMGEACEAHCDEAVADTLSGEGRKAYAMALLHCGEGRVHSMAAGFASPVKRLKKRLGRLVRPVKPRFAVKAAATLALAAFVGAGALAGCALAAGVGDEGTTSMPEETSLPQQDAGDEPAPPTVASSSSISSSEPASLPQPTERTTVHPDVTDADRIATLRSDINRLDILLHGEQAELDEGKLEEVAQAEKQAVIDDLTAQLLALYLELLELNGADTFDYINPVPSYVYSTRGYTGGHQALDINGAFGTGIYATAAGTVVTADWHWTYGWYIVIEHEDGICSLYAHNQALMVQEGDEVAQGDLIAEMGSTGTSTGPHLHFEIILDGVRENPLDYITMYRE